MAPVPSRPVQATQIVVEGVTAYPSGEFATITGGLTGQEVPLPKIEAARTAILHRYPADGYISNAKRA